MRVEYVLFQIFELFLIKIYSGDQLIIESYVSLCLFLFQWDQWLLRWTKKYIIAFEKSYVGQLPKNQGMFIIFIMQQKNFFLQDHTQIERQTSATPMKNLATKFFSVLNQSSQRACKRGMGVRNGSKDCQDAIFTQISDIQSNTSEIDAQDLLFLDQFEQNTKKSSFSDIFPLTANYKHINYTDSLIINLEHTNTFNEESFIQPVNISLLPSEERILLESHKELRRAEIRFDNGAVFRGETKDGKMASGTFVLKQVFIYQGEFQFDKFHGNGILTLTKGHKITCVWNHGRPVGNVVINYPHGQRYEGEIVNFKRHGVGCLYFKDGSRYVGQFQDDNITGQGCYYSIQGEENRGYWANGEYLGEVSYISFTSYKFSDEPKCVRMRSEKQETSRRKIQLQ